MGSETIHTPRFRMGRVFHQEGHERTFEGMFEAGGRAATLSLEAARAWVWLGFVPGDSTIIEGVRCLPGGESGQIVDGRWEADTHFSVNRMQLPSGESALREMAGRVFDSAVDRCIGEHPGRQHIVPISGGMDSRIILAALLERFSPKDIVTYTFGVPGTYDYEIGNRVAKAAGTRHVRFDLSKPTRWRREDLEVVARLTDANNSLFHPRVWLDVIREFGTEGVFWTGYTGDGLGGAAMTRYGQSEDPMGLFIKHELVPAPGSPKDVERLRSLCAETSCIDDVVSKSESIWFRNHVERYTTHHIYLRGCHYASPFMEGDVPSFLLSLPPNHRAGKALFNRWASTRYPKIFQLPTAGYGFKLTDKGPPVQWAWKAFGMAHKAASRAFRPVVHPRIGYWYFDNDVRSGELKKLVVELLEEVHERGLWDRSEWEPLWKAQLAGERWANILLNGASLGVVAGMLDAELLS